MTLFILILAILLSSSGCRLKSALFKTNSQHKGHLDSTICAWNKLRRQFKLDDHTQQLPVKEQITWLIKNQPYLMHLAENGSPYLDFIIKKINEHQVPGEIALLPMLESAFNPFAYSKKGAAGLWQIMPITAKGYKLQRNWWYDGRRDLLESTSVAIEYLKYLYLTFNKDWLLAFAAYNAGPNTVQQAINKNVREGKKTDFWSLRLPKQTQIYVPRLLALSTIIKHPKRFNIELPIFNGKPYFEIVEIGSQIDLTVAAKLAEMHTNELYLLNPGYNRWVTHPEGPHKLLLPIDKVNVFKENLLKISKNVLKPVHSLIAKRKTYLEMLALKKNNSKNIKLKINKNSTVNLKG